MLRDRATVRERIAAIERMRACRTPDLPVRVFPCPQVCSASTRLSPDRQDISSWKKAWGKARKSPAGAAEPAFPGDGKQFQARLRTAATQWRVGGMRVNGRRED